MSEVKPMSPEDIKKGKGLKIPDFVIKAVNKLLIAKCKGNSVATIYKDDVIEEIIFSMKESVALDRGEIIRNGWLDFEPLYRDRGWTVAYKSPGLGESFKDHYIFGEQK